jgi:hypothetical protein
MQDNLLGELRIHRIEACTADTLRDGIWLRFRYTPDTKVFLAGKAALMTLPTRCRRWNPKEKAWWLNEEGLRQLAKRVYCVGYALAGWDKSFADVSAGRAKEQAEHMRFTLPKTSAEAFAALGLHVGAPMPQVLHARRFLARSEHPDVGGTTRAMQRLNVAVDLCDCWWQERQARVP